MPRRCIKEISFLYLDCGSLFFNWMKPRNSNHLKTNVSDKELLVAHVRESTWKHCITRLCRLICKLQIRLNVKLTMKINVNVILQILFLFAYCQNYKIFLKYYNEWLIKCYLIFVKTLKGTSKYININVMVLKF